MGLFKPRGGAKHPAIVDVKVALFLVAGVGEGVLAGLLFQVAGSQSERPSLVQNLFLRPFQKLVQDDIDRVGGKRVELVYFLTQLVCKGTLGRYVFCHNGRKLADVATNSHFAAVLDQLADLGNTF